MAKRKSQPTGAHQVKKQSRSDDHNRAAESFSAGYNITTMHPIFEPLDFYVYTKQERRCAKGGLAVISNHGLLYANVHPYMPQGDWAYTVAHCLLHLGLGHFQEKSHPLEWNVA